MALPEFRKLTAELSLGGLVESERVVALQTPGGTGALRVCGRLPKQEFPWLAHLV